jgi:2-polyprenyl-3-methyl-5-hydroxy-6-metoxy-1,4-benzoquinol methylase
MSNDTWLQFWNRKNPFDDAMIYNHQYFLSKIENYLSLHPQLTVLDIGSGPGHLEDAWHSRVKSIDAADISLRYNEAIRERHRDHSNIIVHDVPLTNYWDLSFLGEKRFDAVIVMSVLQYYKNIGEVEFLLQHIASHVNPGAKVFLCDLKVDHSFVRELFSIFKSSWKTKSFLKTIKLLWQLQFSSYRKVQADHGHLVINKKEWLALFRKLGLNATVLKEPMTLQSERMNVLIQF